MDPVSRYTCCQQAFIAEIAQVDFTRYEHDGQYTNWMETAEIFPLRSQSAAGTLLL